jgi:hypothetical protein
MDCGEEQRLGASKGLPINQKREYNVQTGVGIVEIKKKKDQFRISYSALGT